jgi:large subunit ribosomal protein L22
MEAKATLKTYRQSPRKVRLLVGDLVGQKVDRAKVYLETAPKRVAPVLLKLIKSAEANAREKNVDLGELYIQRLWVDKGPTMFRMRPRAHGRAFVIRKRTSHISVILEAEEKKSEVQKKEKAVSKGKESKKTKEEKSSKIKSKKEKVKS